MPTTKDKLEFSLLMGRHTRASLRQVQALMRYAGTLRAHDEKANREGVSIPEIVKFNRIVKRVHAICREMCEPLPEGALPGIVPVFAGAVLKIRSNSFGDEGIVVPA